MNPAAALLRRPVRPVRPATPATPASIFRVGTSARKVTTYTAEIMAEGVSLAKPLVISYYTADNGYATWAPTLKASVEKFGYEYEIDALSFPDAFTWYERCARKGQYMLDKMREHNRPLLWLDADSEIKSPPTIFDGEPPFDFGVTQIFRSGRLKSGTVYVTPAAMPLLELTAKYCNLRPTWAHEKNLGKAWEETKKLYRTAILPRGYNHVPTNAADHYVGYKEWDGKLWIVSNEKTGSGFAAATFGAKLKPDPVQEKAAARVAHAAKVKARAIAIAVRPAVGIRAVAATVEHELPAVPVRAVDATVERELPAGRQHVLVWVPISTYYSGGRIYCTQLAWCLAQAGNRVTFCGNKKPAWWCNYPATPNLIWGGTAPNRADDFDLVISDGKNPIARAASELAQAKGVPCVQINFETPNWMKLHRPDVAKRMAAQEGYKDLFLAADYVLCISDLSRKYFLEWMGGKVAADKVGILRPGINDVAPPAKSLHGIASLPTRPYVLISGRSDTYKNNAAAMQAVASIQEPLDLVAVGQLKTYSHLRSSKFHKLIHLDGITDHEKLQAMRGAVAVVAPSDFEGFGLVPGEALSVGTPVIVYDLPVLRAEYGDDLTYVPRGNVKALQAAIHTAVKTKPRVTEKAVHLLRQRIGMGAMRKHVETVPRMASERVVLSAVMNAYCCADTVESAIGEVYDHVDQLVIAHGKEAGFPWPADDTLARLKAFPDPQGKIKIIAKAEWTGKTQEGCRTTMRKEACRYVTGNYLMILDADEIWTGFGHYAEALRSKKIKGGCPLGVTFWHDAEHCIRTATLERFGLKSPFTNYGTVWPHARCFPWRAGYRWLKHVCPASHTGQRLWKAEQNMETVKALSESCVLYHLGHALRPEMMRLKKTYYAKRDGQERSRDAWLNWNGQLGDCGDGIVEPVTWQLPESVRIAFRRIASTGGTQ